MSLEGLIASIRESAAPPRECNECGCAADATGNCACCPGSPDGDHVTSDGATDCDYCGADRAGDQ